jgi:hypothetical protein
MTASQARATQTPNHTILILASSNFSQLAKSIEESFSGHTGSRRSGESANRASNQCSQLQTIFYSPPQRRPDLDPQPETIAQFFKEPILSQACESGRCSLMVATNHFCHASHVPPVRLEVLGEGGSGRQRARRRESIIAGTAENLVTLVPKFHRHLLLPAEDPIITAWVMLADTIDWMAVSDRSCEIMRCIDVGEKRKPLAVSAHVGAGHEQLDESAGGQNII